MRGRADPCATTASREHRSAGKAALDPARLAQAPRQLRSPRRFMIHPNVRAAASVKSGMRPRSALGRLLCTIAVPGLLACVACGPSQTVESSGDTAVVAALPTINSADPPPFSDASRRKIKRAGTTFRPIESATSPPKITLERAQQLATENLGILREAHPAEAQYADVTNSIAARLTTTQDKAPRTAQMRATIVNRPMWLLLYHDIKMPHSVPVQLGPGKRTIPSFSITDFLVYVDASTGEIPRAETL